MVTINDSTVRANVFETVYDLINSSLNSISASSTPTLYAGYPDNNNIDFPIIIIKPVDVSKDTYTIDTTHTSNNKRISVFIEIYATKNKDLDIIADYITNLLDTPINGIFLSEVSDDFMFNTANNSKVKGKTLTLLFNRR
ncbi:MAG TPA: hypothetical protein V6C58_06545 [Allocoleopsis sp.]